MWQYLARRASHSSKSFNTILVWRQNLHDFSRLVFVGIATVNHGVRQHHNLNDVSASEATNTDTPAVGEFCDSLIVEPEFIDAVGAVEQRNACCHGTSLNRKQEAGRRERFTLESLLHSRAMCYASRKGKQRLSVWQLRKSCRSAEADYSVLRPLERLVFLGIQIFQRLGKLFELLSVDAARLPYMRVD